ncbi:hypothetical protein [Dactylosporangium cerinum]
MAVVRGLLVLQGAFGLTGTLGVLTLMGFNPSTRSCRSCTPRCS